MLDSRGPQVGEVDSEDLELTTDATLLRLQLAPQSKTGRQAMGQEIAPGADAQSDRSGERGPRPSNGLLQTAQDGMLYEISGSNTIEQSMYSLRRWSSSKLGISSSSRLSRSTARSLCSRPLVQ